MGNCFSWVRRCLSWLGWLGGFVFVCGLTGVGVCGFVDEFVAFCSPCIFNIKTCVLFDVLVSPGL